jgi:hypothetical protein
MHYVRAALRAVVLALARNVPQNPFVGSGNCYNFFLQGFLHCEIRVNNRASPHRRDVP